jgi:hypothetical protein
MGGKATSVEPLSEQRESCHQNVNRSDLEQSVVYATIMIDCGNEKRPLSLNTEEREIP